MRPPSGLPCDPNAALSAPPPGAAGPSAEQDELQLLLGFSAEELQDLGLPPLQAAGAALPPGAAGPSALPQSGLQPHSDYTTQPPPAAGPSADPSAEAAAAAAACWRRWSGRRIGGGVPGLDFLSASVPQEGKTYCWGGILEGVMCPNHVDEEQQAERSCYYCAAHQLAVRVPLARVRISHARGEMPAAEKERQGLHTLLVLHVQPRHLVDGVRGGVGIGEVHLAGGNR